jgi:outer membrane protein assembly factor BamB
MKNLFLTAIIAVMAINLGLYAEEKAQAEPKVTLELVYKMEFNKIISADGFPPPEIKQILKEKDIPQEDKEWLLNSLRIEIAKRKKILYTNDGKAIKLPDDLQSISTSKNLKYMIVYAAHTDYGGLTAEEVKELKDEWLKAFKNYDQWRAKYEKATAHSKEAYKDSMYYWLKIRDNLERRLSNIQKNTKYIKTVICLETEIGRVLWKKEGEKYSLTGKDEDIFPPSFISDDGKVSIAVPGLGPVKHLYTSIYFYDKYGNEKKVVTGLHGRHGCHDLSSDGEMFCTLIQIKYNDTKIGAVAAYDKDGNELWITEITGTWPDANPCLAVSANHKYIAASIGGTSLIDDKGNVINTYNFKTYYPGFSYDEEYLIAGTLRDTMYFINTTTNKTLWQKSLGGHSHKKPIMTADGHLIFFVSLLAGQPPAQVIDEKGNSIWKGSPELENAIGLSPSGYFFIPGSDPELIIYRILSGVSNED